MCFKTSLIMQIWKTSFLFPRTYTSTIKLHSGTAVAPTSLRTNWIRVRRSEHISRYPLIATTKILWKSSICSNRTRAVHSPCPNDHSGIIFRFPSALVLSTWTSAISASCSNSNPQSSNMGGDYRANCGAVIPREKWKNFSNLRNPLGGSHSPKTSPNLCFKFVLDLRHHILFLPYT